MKEWDKSELRKILLEAKAIQKKYNMLKSIEIEMMKCQPLNTYQPMEQGDDGEPLCPKIME